MKKLLFVPILLLAACATLTPREGVLLTDAITIAKIAGTAAATTYGGPMAGVAASAGLNALGTVAQGYINKKLPTAVVEASPGIDGVGEAVASVISTKGTVTQGDVDTIFTAAKLVAK